jgi:pyruvate/2-oxoglutarate dehydrogenase complex dihydrolipoamide dehydrogenase (E3) component
MHPPHKHRRSSSSHVHCVFQSKELSTRILARSAFNRCVGSSRRICSSSSSSSSREESHLAGQQKQHVVVVGGGAAGLTAAYFAASAGAKVTVIERTREAGAESLESLSSLFLLPYFEAVYTVAARACSGL